MLWLCGGADLRGYKQPLFWDCRIMRTLFWPGVFLDVFRMCLCCSSESTFSDACCFQEPLGYIISLAAHCEVIMAFCERLKANDGFGVASIELWVMFSGGLSHCRNIMRLSGVLDCFTQLTRYHWKSVSNRYTK